MRSEYRKTGWHRRCRSLVLAALLAISLTAGAAPARASTAETTAAQETAAETTVAPDTADEAESAAEASGEESTEAASDSEASEAPETEDYSLLENTIVGICAMPLSYGSSAYTKFMRKKNMSDRIKTIGTYEETGKPAVALTFDDGPSKQTSKILDILEENGVPATFFIVGKNVANFEDTLKREVSLGCELGSHTWNHADLTTLTAEQVDNQFNRSISTIEEASGGKVTLIRPPYGSVNSAIKEQLELPIIFWSLDTLDWKTRDAQSTIDAVESSVEGGDIILFHDLYSETASAVEVIVPWLMENGYEILTVSELYEYYGDDLTLHKGHGHA